VVLLVHVQMQVLVDWNLYLLLLVLLIAVVQSALCCCCFPPCLRCVVACAFMIRNTQRVSSQ
jgi:hypothetical protein